MNPELKTREEKMKELFEIKPTKQMEIFNQELTKMHKAGFTGKEAFQAALAIAGKKVNSGKKTRSRAHFQLRWNFGRPDLPGQKYLNLTGGEERTITRNQKASLENRYILSQKEKENES